MAQPYSMDAVSSIVPGHREMEGSEAPRLLQLRVLRGVSSSCSHHLPSGNTRSQGGGGWGGGVTRAATGHTRTVVDRVTRAHGRHVAGDFQSGEERNSTGDSFIY